MIDGWIERRKKEANPTLKILEDTSELKTSIERKGSDMRERIAYTDNLYLIFYILFFSMYVLLLFFIITHKCLLVT